MDIAVDALRISPKYSSKDWEALAVNNPSHWAQAADIVRDRLEGRFLRFANNWLPDPFSGFIILAVDSLLAETIQQFRAGETDGAGKSERYIKQFLAGPRFQPDFDKHARTRFYKDIRCGLLHQAEAKEMWLVRRNQKTMLSQVSTGKGYVLDVKRFHAAVCLSLDDYLRDIVHPSQGGLRVNLWKKMEQLCAARTARGLLYEANGGTANGTRPPNNSLHPTASGGG